MTKSELKVIGEAAGMELDDEMTFREMYAELMNGLENKPAPAPVAVAQAQTVKIAEPVNPYIAIQEEEEQKLAVLNKKYEGKVFAGCVLGMTRKKWYRGNLKFVPNEPTYFWVGSEGLGKKETTGIEIERILKEPNLIVVELDSKSIPPEDAFALLLAAKPSVQQIFIQQTQMDKTPKVIKSASPQLQTANLPGATLVSETTTITQETVPIRGKEF